MSQPQAQLSEDQLRDISIVQNNINNLQSMLFAPETPEQDKPFIQMAITDAQLAVGGASQGLSVDLSQFLSLESLLRGGLEREMRRQQTQNIFNQQTAINDQIQLIDEQILNLQLSPSIDTGQVQQLEQEKVLLNQQLLGLQDLAANQQRFDRTTQTRRPLQAQFLSPEAEASLNTRMYDNEFVNALKDGLTLEEAQAEAAKKVQQLNNRLIIDPSGQQSILAQVMDPAERVDFAAGTIRDPQTNQVRDMTVSEVIDQSLRPQILGTEEATGVVRTARDVLPRPEDLSDVVQLGRDIRNPPNLLEPTPVTVGNQNILVESPLMYTIRVAGFVPSAATGAITNALTYTIDDDGNPVDPNDFSYKLNQLGIVQAYNNVLPAVSYFQPVKSDRAWANATTTLNAAAAGVAEGLTVFEVKKSAPNLNIDMQYYRDKIAKGDLSAFEYASLVPFYLADTATGVSALALDVLMPLDPLTYLSPVTKAARLGVKAATKPTLGLTEYILEISGPTSATQAKALRNVKQSSEYIQKKLVELEKLSFTQLSIDAIAGIKSLGSKKVYQTELNQLVDDALQGNYQSTIKKASIRSMQDTAAREVADNLTNLQMYRLNNMSTNATTTPFVRKVIDDGYEQWSTATRQKDSPFAGVLAVSDEIVQDVRLLRQGGVIPKASLYGSAFRSNLMRSGVKRGKYRGKLLESYRTNNPDAVPDDFYRVLVDDPDVLEEAMYKTLRDQVKDELFARLPVNQIMVGGNRIINIGLWNLDNQRKVADVVTRLTRRDSAGRLIADSDEMIDAFVAGIGLDEVRSSRGLQKIVSKLDNNLLQKLTADEYRIYEQGILGHAWDTAVAETRQPILMTETAYIEAAEMRSNSVAQARARSKAIEYAKMVREDARGPLEGIVSLFAPSVVLRTRQRLINSGQDVISNRALLASVKIKDPKISKTPKPYLDLQYRVNNLRSTAFDQMINDIEFFMKQDKDGTVVLNRLLVSAFDEQVKVKFRLVNSRYEREYRHLRKTLSDDEATEIAYRRAVKEIQSEKRYNTWLEGFDVEDVVKGDIDGYRIDDVVVPKAEAIEKTLYNAVVEEQLFKVLSRFFDNIWFVPQTKSMKTGQYVSILRQAAADADGLNTALLQTTAAKILDDNPDLISAQLRTTIRGGDETDLAWTEAMTLLTLSLRGEVVMKAGIDELLMLYPSMYMDLVLTPLQKLQKSISTQRVTSTTTQMLFETEKNPLFRALNNGELQESFRQAQAGTKFADQPPNLQAAKQRFEDDLRSIFPAKDEDFYNDIFRASRQLLNTIDKGASKVLMMSSQDLGNISTSIIDGMVKAKVANKGPARDLTKIVSKSSYASTYDQFTYDLQTLLDLADINVKASSKYRSAGISGLFGLNGSYTGNLADLRLNIDINTSRTAGTAPLVFVEKEIDNMLRSYGVTIGPTTTDKYAAQFINMYRPYLSVLDSEGVALFMGREMFDEFENLKALSRGDDWTNIIDNYRTLTQVYAQGRGALSRQNMSYIGGNFFDILNRISTTGLLGGIGLQNTRYLGINFFSAPLLMATELGVSDTLRSLSWLHVDHKFVRGNWNPEDVMMVTRNGQTITYGQYADLVSNENIATTFSAAQFQKTSMSELMRELSLGSDFKTVGPSRQFVRWYLDPRKRTRFTMWSHYTDMRLRRATFTQALYDGLTPKQAATRSREALLDYGKARNTVLEKTAGTTIAFWSFQWMSFKGVLSALWRGKGDVVRIIRAQEGFAKQQDSYYVGDTREHARIFRYVTKKGQERNEMAVGFYNPAYESMGILIDGMAYIGALAASQAYDDANISASELQRQFVQAVIDRKPLMPITNIGLELIGQYQGKGKLNPYQGTRFLPPAYIALMDKQGAEFETTLRYVFDIDLQPVAPREGDPTYNGRSFKFANEYDERMFYNLESLLFITGVQRRLLDTIKLSYASDVDFTGGQLGLSRMQLDRGYYSAVQDLYRQAGMSSPIQLQMSAALSYELGLISMVRDDTPEALFIKAELRRQKQKEAVLPVK